MNQTSKEKKTILVIDDEEQLNNSTKILLQTNGYEVDSAINGNEGLQKIQNKVYNLAIIDVKLPDMQGTELLSKIQKTQPTCKKIMITGYPNLQNTISSINQGADAYLTKPYNPEKLIDLVKQKLEQQKNEKIITEKKIGNWIEQRAKRLML